MKQTTINIVLEPDLIGAGEVVVTALGIIREKKSLGFAVSEVEDSVSLVKDIILVNSLAGRVFRRHV
ncbi:MAG: hypothetical protein R2744_00140 [Bacteroidales bacterium]